MPLRATGCARARRCASSASIDLANLASSNEYIVQHLRESILVVDARGPHPPHQRDGRERCCGGPIRSGAPLERGVAAAAVPAASAGDSARNWTAATMTVEVASDGGTVIRPHFVSLLGSEPRTGARDFLEDTT